MIISGSGRCFWAKNTLCLRDSIRLGRVRARGRCWTYEGEDGPHATIRYEADLRDNDNASIRLRYGAHGETVDYKVQLPT